MELVGKTMLEKLVKERYHMSGMITTVFGGTGFVGRYVVSRLGRIGSQIIVPYRGEEKICNHLKTMGDVGQILPVRFSIRNQDQIDKSVSHSNVVINLLGKHYPTRNFSLEEANVESAQRIARAATKAGVQRFVLLSCLGADSDSSSAVLKIKAEAERVTREEFPAATILRVAPVFGYEDRLLNKYGKISSAWPMFVPMACDQNSRVQPVYVRDVASAVMAVLAEPSAGNVYNLGGPHVYTIRQLVQRILFYAQYEGHKLPLQLPESLAKIFSKWIEKTAWIEPLYIADEWNYHSKDLVVPEKSLGFGDLNIKPTSLDEVALNIIRPYRKPMRYNEIRQDEAEKRTS